MGDAKQILLVWLDVETTGLNPDRHQLLEVACTLSDVTGDTGEHPVFEVVLPHRAPVDADIAVMHGGRGGLLDVCRNVPGDHATLLTAFDAHLAGELAAYDATRMLAGHSVHFDRGWLDVHMPATAAMLSHRIVDVRSLVTAAGAAGLDLGDAGRPAHRARADMLNSLATYRQIVATMQSAARRARIAAHAPEVANP